MKIHPDIRKFLDVELVNEPTEQCGQCLNWFRANAPKFAAAVATLAKSDWTAEQIYNVVQDGPTETWADVEKHKTIVAAIEWCVRRRKQDVAAMRVAQN